MKQPPEKVRIAGRDYRIVEMSKDEATHSGCCGRYYPDHLEIRVDFTEPDPMVFDTVIHEVMHAVIDLYGIKQGDDEERLVRTLAVGWAQVLSDNLPFAEWLAEGGLTGVKR